MVAVVSLRVSYGMADVFLFVCTTVFGVFDKWTDKANFIEQQYHRWKSVRVRRTCLVLVVYRYVLLSTTQGFDGCCRTTCGGC